MLSVALFCLSISKYSASLYSELRDDVVVGNQIFSVWNIHLSSFFTSNYSVQIDTNILTLDMYPHKIFSIESDYKYKMSDDAYTSIFYSFQGFDTTEIATVSTFSELTTLTQNDFSDTSRIELVDVTTLKSQTIDFEGIPTIIKRNYDDDGTKCLVYIHGYGDMRNFYITHEGNRYDAFVNSNTIYSQVVRLNSDSWSEVDGNHVLSAYDKKCDDVELTSNVQVFNHTIEKSIFPKIQELSDHMSFVIEYQTSYDDNCENLDAQIISVLNAYTSLPNIYSYNATTSSGTCKYKLMVDDTSVEQLRLYYHKLNKRMKLSTLEHDRDVEIYQVPKYTVSFELDSLPQQSYDSTCSSEITVFSS